MKVKRAYVSAYAKGVTGLRCFEAASPNSSVDQVMLELPDPLAKSIALQLIGRFDKVLAARVRDQIIGT